MAEILIHQNSEDGARWWAEDGAGYYEYADSIQELLLSVQEWAEWQELQAVTIQLDPELDEEESLRAAYDVRKVFGTMRPLDATASEAVKLIFANPAIA